MKVIKRNGELVNFDRSKIYIAILGAFRDEKIKNSEQKVGKILDLVLNEINKLNVKKISVEKIQDIVEDILMTENKALADNIDIAGQSAVAHFKMAKGVEKIRKALEESLGVLEEANANSLEYAEALGSVRDAVTETFGLEVSANFVEDNLQTIKKMIEGNVEALKELQKLVISDFIIGLQLESNAKNNL